MYGNGNRSQIMIVDSPSSYHLVFFQIFTNGIKQKAFSTIGLNWSETFKNKLLQNMIIFLVPMNIPELAASEFFSNFVWTIILWQKLALGFCESNFSPKIQSKWPKTKLQKFCWCYKKLTEKDLWTWLFLLEMT